MHYSAFVADAGESNLSYDDKSILVVVSDNNVSATTNIYVSQNYKDIEIESVLSTNTKLNLDTDKYLSNSKVISSSINNAENSNLIGTQQAYDSSSVIKLELT